MLILGIDTATPTAAVAIYDSDKRTFLAQVSLYAGRTHGATLFPLIERTLQDAHLTVADLDVIAAVAGPGSYTGLRIGVAAVQGIAVAANKPALAVSTLEAIAWSYANVSGYLSPILPARAETYYAGIYKTDSGIITVDTPDALFTLPEITQIRDALPTLPLILDAPPDGCAKGACLAATHHPLDDPLALRPRYLQPPAIQKQTTK